MDFDPKLPPKCSTLKITGINFHGAEFNINVDENIVIPDITVAGNGLEIVQNEENTTVNERTELLLDRLCFTLRPLNVEYLERCPLPLDKIGG